MQGAQKLIRELESWRVMAHPNICRLFEVHETPMAFAFVSECCEGGDLLERINEYGFMPEPEAKVYFRQLVSAVGHCHDRGIVHRDLKLENILVDADGTLKLADFGFAGFFDPTGRKRMNEYCGSPPYAAPEIFMGRPYLGPEIDAWSLGVVLYALVSGSLPFTAPNLEELGSQVVEGRFDKPFFLSAEVVRLISGLIRVNPARRFSLTEVRTSPWFHDPAAAEAEAAAAAAAAAERDADEGALTPHTAVTSVAGPEVERRKSTTSVVGAPGPCNPRRELFSGGRAPSTEGRARSTDSDQTGAGPASLHPEPSAVDAQRDSGSAEPADAEAKPVEIFLFDCSQCSSADSAPWDFEQKRPGICKVCADAAT